MKLVEETCGFQNVQLPCSSEFISLAEIIMSGENGLMCYQCKKRQSSLYRVIGEDKEVADNLQGSYFHQLELNLETQSSLLTSDMFAAIICGTFSCIILLTSVESGCR